MPVFFQYLIKLSISLAIMYLFYQVVLRRLTFYNHNRWYLFGYSVLCFFISMINIAPFLESGDGGAYELINILPSVSDLTVTAYFQPSETSPGTFSWSAWDWSKVILAAGIAVLTIRLIFQFVSFRRLQKNARLVTGDGIRFYQVNRNIIPFSFGKSIYINQHLHSEAELREIVRHEFVHVKQRHTFDIIWSELLCIVNWYNPFAWLIKKAIRQNLEFIADNKVIANGVDKKQYQYLLLKVIGNNQFSITSQFNFTSLKKRIIMMNKIKSARVHLVKFLFVLPLLATVLLAFRSPSLTQKPMLRYASMVIDADTKAPVSGANILNINTGKLVQSDERGYFSMELPADQPIHVKTLISKEGYSNLETNTFSLEKKNNTESIGLMEVIAIKKGNALDKCTGCSSSISLREEKNEHPGYNEVRKYYEKLLIGLPAYIADTVPAKAAVPKTPPQGSTRAAAPSQVSPAAPSKPAAPANGVSVQPAAPGKTLQLDLKKASGNPVVFVDGKEWPSELGLNLIDGARIESLNIYKGESATSIYGEKAKDGVIAIVTKKSASVSQTELLSKPLYYINGKKVTKQTLDLIDPSNIQSIDVLKGPKAIEKYGDDGKNGVIEITVPVV